MLFSDKKKPAKLRIVERRGGCDATAEKSKFRLNELPARLRAAQPVELGPTLGLHGDGSRDGGSAFGVLAFRSFGAARSFARAAVGGGIFHFKTTPVTACMRHDQCQPVSGLDVTPGRGCAY